MTVSLPTARDRIVFPLDYPSLGDAKAGAAVVRGHVGVLKVGLELFTLAGPAAVETVDSDAKIFLDLKLHDIPATVERATRAAGKLGVAYLTIHASGGRAMLEAAARAAAEFPNLRLLAVTVLTSLDAADLEDVGVKRSAADHVEKLAQLAWDAGVTGFVCSAVEVSRLRQLLPAAWLVTPGIRPAHSQSDDQKRVVTPADAIKAGADLLVVGRPIRDASDPAAAADRIAAEIEAALGAR